jgi:adenosylcobyric acid synthase
VEAVVIVRSVELGVRSDRETLKGYEIHMGRTTGDVGIFSLKRMSSNSALRTPHSELIPDGSAKGNVWGTYIHGIFDNDNFRRGLINALRDKRGLKPVNDVMDFQKARDGALDKWADVLRESIDMRFIQDLIT